MPRSVKHPEPVNGKDIQVRFVDSTDEKLEFVDGFQTRYTDEQFLVSWMQTFPTEDKTSVVKRTVARHVLTWPQTSRAFTGFGRALARTNLALLQHGLTDLFVGLGHTEKKQALAVIQQVLKAVEEEIKDGHQVPV